MDYVIRRKTPNAKGARYFCNTGPAQTSVVSASRFTEENANAARRALKEPHLWEVLHVSDAAAMDMKIAADLKREMAAEHRARPRGRAAMMALWGLASSGIADMPRRGS